jgi:bifunctional non-homologous end joining protein LigD
LLRRLPTGPPAFIEPMQCKLVDSLPKTGDWFFELKFDGFRALAVKNGMEIQLISRNKKDLSAKFPELIDSLSKLPVKRAVIDGEIVALDDRGRPSFQILQNLGTAGSRNLVYYAFDLLNYEGRNTQSLPIEYRKALIQPLITAGPSNLGFSRAVEGTSKLLLEQVRTHSLEGIVAKKAGSHYEPGQRSGTWIKYKNLQEQEFVIGGYTAPEGTRGEFGALVVGFYENGRLHFASKVGTGFTANLLRELYKQFQPLRQTKCPFVNLPETSSGRWGEGLTAAEMKRVAWLKPKLVAQIAFTEWTEGNHLRHPSFKGLREDKSPREVTRERPG